MKKVASLLIVTFIFIFAVPLIAADKVVVIPLNSASVSASQTNWINLNVFDAHLTDGAFIYVGNAENSGIFLPPSGSPDFTWAFVIPPNYKTGTDLTVHIVWSTLHTNCEFVFVPYRFNVIRVGSTPVTDSENLEGLSIVGGNVVPVGSVASLSSEILASITSPNTETSLQPLDSVSFTFSRLGTNPEDTCNGDIYIHGAYISYTTQ